MKLDPDHLATLAAILRTGSFDGAAQVLSITPPAVSQRIRALEERIGTTLIERGTPCRGTETGRRLARHAEALALLEQDLARDISGMTPGHSTVRIATNADSLALWVVPALAQVPDMLFDLVIDDQDHSGDWLKRGDVAGAITAHAAPIRGCSATPLGALRYIACASPGFVAKHFANGLTAPALKAAPALRFNTKDQLQTDWIRAATGHDVTPDWHQIAAVDAFNQAVVHGLGWGLIPVPLAAPLLQSGQLVALIPETPHDVPLFWQVSRLVAEPLKPLTRALRQSAARVLIG